MKKLLRLLLPTILIFTASLSDALANNIVPIHTFKLKNGLILHVKEDHRAPIVAIQIWYKVGSSYEPNGITGISHALEHMMFKGTSRYPSGELDKIVTGLGGDFNAFTSYDATCYLTNIAATHLEKILELEADRMQSLNLNSNEFAKEMKVIQEERLMRTDNNPQALTRERFMAGAYLAAPYHHPPIGWMSDIKNYALTDLQSWYKQWYTPNNAIVVIVGDVNPATVHQLIQKYFATIPARVLPNLKPHPDVPQIGQRVINVERPARLPWLTLGYLVPTINTSDPNLKWEPFALSLLEACLSGGNSSRLTKNLVRGQEIASSASASYDPYSLYEGIFTLDATPTLDHNTTTLQQSLLAQIEKLKNELVSTQELQRIKNQFIAEQIYSKDSISSQATEIGNLASVNLPVELSENYLAEISKITPEQLQQVAKKYFVATRLIVAELKPLPMDKNQKNIPAPTTSEASHALH